MKSPPQQFTDDDARRLVEEFVADEAALEEESAQDPAEKNGQTSVTEKPIKNTVMKAGDGQ